MTTQIYPLYGKKNLSSRIKNYLRRERGEGKIIINYLIVRGKEFGSFFGILLVSVDPLIFLPPNDWTGTYVFFITLLC